MFRCFPKLARALLPLVLIINSAVPAHVQVPFSDPFPTSRWCEDSGTACWSNPARRDWLNGVRIIADFDVRFLFQRGAGRFTQSRFLSLPKLAFEVNLYRSWVAFQFAIRGPGQIEIDSLSPTRNRMVNRAGIIPSDISLAAGFSFFDSSVALMGGWMAYDRRHFTVGRCGVHEAHQEKQRRLTGSGTVTANCLLPPDERDTYIYLTFQPISAVRSGIKANERSSVSPAEP